MATLQTLQAKLGAALDEVNALAPVQPALSTAVDSAIEELSNMNATIQTTRVKLAIALAESDAAGLTSVSAKLSAAIAEADAALGGVVPPVGVADLSVNLDFGGGNVAMFAGASAIDKGDFVGEIVRQKCYLCTNPAFPDWRVWLRVDANSAGGRIQAPAAGWRDEVIVEYGRSSVGPGTNSIFTNRTGSAPYFNLVPLSLATRGEVWTITALSSTSLSVSGSIHGAQPNITLPKVLADTLATPYTNPYISVSFLVDSAAIAVGTKWVTTVGFVYQATISKNGVSVYSKFVPKHMWLSRWRWSNSAAGQNQPRPVVFSAAQVKQRKWVPNFGPKGMFTQPKTASGGYYNRINAPWPEPGRSPIEFNNSRDWIGTGGGGSLGLVTEYAGDYLICENATSLRSIMVEAEWSGQWQTCFRDDSSASPTYAPRNVNSPQILRFKSAGGATGVIWDTPLQPGNGSTRTDGDFVAMHYAHWYANVNVPAMLTEDPYLIEQLQFSVIYLLLWGGSTRAVTKDYSGNALPGIILPTSERAWFHGVKQIMCAEALTPASAPSWMLPKTWFQSCMNDNRRMMEKYLSRDFYPQQIAGYGESRLSTVFRTGPNTIQPRGWMGAWACTQSNLAAARGFPGWDAIAKYLSARHIAHTNGTSGWNRRWPCPVYESVDMARFMPPYASDPDTPPRTYLTNGTASDATSCTSWAHAWQFFKSGYDDAGTGFTWANNWNGIVIDESTWPNDDSIQMTNSYIYALDTRAALVSAANNGNAAAIPCYTYLDQWLPRLVGIRAYQAQTSVDPI